MLENLIEKSNNPLSIEQFKKILQLNENLIILDTRPATDFTKEFIPSSISIGFEGRFSEWAASLLSTQKSIVLISEIGTELEVVKQLVHAGFQKIEGFLKGGFNTWKNADEKIDMIIDVESDELVMDIPFDSNIVIIDVRRKIEFADGHLEKAINIPLSEMTDPASIANFEDHENLYIHCAKGYRSVIAASILKHHGYHNIRNVLGGWDKIKEEKIKIIKETAALN